MPTQLKITKSLSVESHPDGIVIRGYDLENTEPSKVPGVAAFVASIPGLVSEGIIEKLPDGDFISNESLGILEAREHDPLAFLINWSRFELQITAVGTIGFSDFRFIPRFVLGNAIVKVEAEGGLAWRNTKVVRLPAIQAMTLAIVGEFNQLPEKERTKDAALRILAKLKQLAVPDRSLTFDEYLRSENVIIAERTQIGFQDDGKRVTVYPVIEGAEEDELKKRFLSSGEVRDVYDLEIPGGRQRVVITPELKAIFKAIKDRGMLLSGEKRTEFFRNPRSILPEDESINPELLELVGLGPRVKGIGVPSFVRAIPTITDEKWFGEDKLLSPKDRGERTRKLSLQCDFIEGEKKVIEFDNAEKAAEFIQLAQAAVSKGNAEIEWEKVSIPVTQRFVEECEAILQTRSRKPSPEDGTATESKGKHVLLIHTNEEQQEYVEETVQKESFIEFVNPRSLLKEDTLKKHQVVGVKWMQNLVSNDISKGCLLADDMGLGKTLQVLSFVAWAIENGFKEILGGQSPPYEPVLLVAPLILIPNWVKEVNRYFDTNVFMPFQILHGRGLRDYKTKNSDTGIGQIERSSLSTEKIQENRLIITNYDTLKNYQYSFAKVPWSIVILDEAQEIKEPSTAISYAVKALNPLFRIAMTGTPVETSIGNLWSILDFACPGNALGSLREFLVEYAGKSSDVRETGKKLRHAVKFNQAKGIVKRRTKAEAVADLPKKQKVVIDCEFGGPLKSRYLEIIDETNKSHERKSAALRGLQSISLLSQHPLLIEDNVLNKTVKELLAQSSKLQALCELLKTIRKKDEKTLVFTRSRKMQDILKKVLDETFDLDCSIINGSAASGHQYVSSNREQIIEKFSNSHGFNVLILSPEVAGVGLTITAANHVVHYGRWWNPAKENQATDRVYRIGQDKPVFVYYLILKDSSGQIETFDEKLNRLIENRENVADSFLTPVAAEDEVNEGLLNSIFDAQTTTKVKSEVIKDLSEISHFEFEALIGILFRGQFEQIVLTPRAGDRGVDVIGLSHEEIALIQCKQFDQKTGLVGEDVLRELVDGSDYYRERVFVGNQKRRRIKLMAVTSARFDKKTKIEAKNSEVDLYEGNEIYKMLSARPVSMVEIKNLDSLRPKNMLELLKMIQQT